MGIRVGINGFGRIGRNFFRAQQQLGADVEIVAVNDLGDAKTMAHLLKYDSVMGPFAGDVSLGDGVIRAGGEEMKMLSERDPAALPWGELGVDVVLESTGFFTNREGAQKHIDAGREEGHHLCPCDRPGLHRRARRQRRGLRPRAAPHRVERVLHDELHRAARQGDRRPGRDRVGLHDHDPRVHERPEHPRPAAQGPAPRPCRRDQPDPDIDGCRQGHRPRAAAPAGQARRCLRARSCPDGLAHRPRGQGRPGRDRGRGRRRLPRCRRRPARRPPPVPARSASSPATSRARRTRASTTPS